MSRTKTQLKTDREQYTRSSAATTRLLTLVRPAETLACDWPNTNERQEMVMSTITFLNTIYRRNIKSTRSLRHVLRILETTINDSLSKAGMTNLEQTPLNRSQQLPAPCKWLINGLKQNYVRENDWSTDYLTNNKRLFNSDNRRIETHQWDYESLQPITTRLNWQTTKNIAT